MEAINLLMEDLKLSAGIGPVYTPKGLLSSILDGYMTLVVGAARVRFYVEKSVLGNSGGFFESACKEEWTRPKDNNTIILPDDDPIIVGIVVTWMYKNELRLPARHFRGPPRLDKNAPGLDNGPGLLARLWVFGERYQISKLRNDVSDAMIIYIRSCGIIPGAVIKYTWENTGEKATLCEILARYARSQFIVSDALGQWLYLSDGFTARLLELLICSRDNPGAFKACGGMMSSAKEFCDWHEHTKEDKGKCVKLREYELEEC